MRPLIAARILPLLILGACAGGQNGPIAPPGPKGDLMASMPYTRFEINTSAACGGLSTPPVGQPSGSYYIRLGALYSSTSADDAMTYEKRTRWMPVRALWSEKIGFTLSANITVDSQPAYQATIPLYATSHDSGQMGENFATDLDLLWQNTYIKVQLGSSIKVQFESRYSKQVESSALGAALRVTKTAISAVSPQAKILTNLNQDRLQTEARLWDKALGQMFSSNATEGINVTTTPQQIGGNTCGKLTLFAPGYDQNLDPQIGIGTWRVGINDWRRSIFTEEACVNATLDLTCARRITAGLTPANVLGEPLGGGKTVADYLKDRDIVPIAFANNDIEEGNEAASFCRRVTSSLVTLGLNDIDARLGMWAFAKGYAMPGQIATAIQRSDDCKNLIQPFAF